MVLRLNEIGRAGIGLLFSLVLGWTAGCAGDDSLVLPPGGLLDEAIYDWNPADEAPPPVRKESARASAKAKKNAAAKTPPPPARSAQDSASETAAASSAYVLQAGDEIDIQVYREPELSGAF